MPEIVFSATTSSDFAAYGELIREYVDWLRTRIRQDGWFMERVLSHQSLDRELDTLPVKYGPPGGRAILVGDGTMICGGGAYHRLGDGICEMKRLFVRPQFQGKGIGRKLCAALIDAAIVDGYSLMRLDTSKHLVEAIAMYEKLGFHHCPAYQDYPQELMPYLVFMERPLSSA